MDLNGAGTALMNQSTGQGNYAGDLDSSLTGAGPYQYPYTTGYIWTYPYYQTIYVDREVEPKTCRGKAHVFDCAHVSECQCGAVKRVMPRVKSTTKAKKGK